MVQTYGKSCQCAQQCSDKCLTKCSREFAKSQGGTKESNTATTEVAKMCYLDCNHKCFEECVNNLDPKGKLMASLGMQTTKISEAKASTAATVETLIQAPPSAPQIRQKPILAAPGSEADVMQLLAAVPDAIESNSAAKMAQALGLDVSDASKLLPSAPARSQASKSPRTKKAAKESDDLNFLQDMFADANAAFDTFQASKVDPVSFAKNGNDQGVTGFEMPRVHARGGALLRHGKEADRDVPSMMDEMEHTKQQL